MAAHYILRSSISIFVITIYYFLREQRHFVAKNKYRAQSRVYVEHGRGGQILSLLISRDSMAIKGAAGMNGTDIRIEHVSPTDAWNALQDQSTPALLIDVRTRAEWSFVGVPDLSQLGQQAAFIEWQSFPTMEMNGDFTTAAMSLVEQSGTKAVYFLCRSGVRSHHAAVAVTAACSRGGHDVACINIAEGFEGDLNGEGRRGQVNGWKAHGLPWQQS